MENGGLCHLSILNACTDQTNAAPTANHRPVTLLEAKRWQSSSTLSSILSLSHLLCILERIKCC
jgi:hypothetical protein